MMLSGLRRKVMSSSKFLFIEVLKIFNDFELTMLLSKLFQSIAVQVKKKRMLILFCFSNVDFTDFLITLKAGYLADVCPQQNTANYTTGQIIQLILNRIFGLKIC